MSATEPHANALVPAGERYGPFALVHEIGRGGMGSVWLAERVEGDFTQRVALKLIRADLATSEVEACRERAQVQQSLRARPPQAIWRRRAGGSGEPEQLTRVDLGGKRAQLVHHVSPDGRYVAYDQFNDINDVDIDLYDLQTKQSVSWLKTPQVEQGARISPDGRMVAYRSNIRRRDEIYTKAFDGEQRWHVSTEGGSDPRWRADGRALFYALAGTVYGATLEAGDDLAPGVPQAVVEGDYRGAYEVFPDGKRFLMRRRVREPGGAGPLIDIER